MRCSPETIAALQLALATRNDYPNEQAHERLSERLVCHADDIISDLVLLASIQAKLRGVGEIASR